MSGTGQGRLRRPGRLAAEERLDGDDAGGVAGLEATHRPHPQSRQPACARVSGDVVCGGSGSGQDELAGQRSVVDGASNVVPQGRHRLPFVQEAGGGTVQGQRCVDLGSTPRGSIDIQADDAGGSLHGADGFAARLRALDDDGASAPQAVVEFLVDDSRSVRKRPGGAWRVRRPASVGIPHSADCNVCMPHNAMSVDGSSQHRTPSGG